LVFTGEQRRLVRELECQYLIFLERIGDKLGKADGIVQACGDTPGRFGANPQVVLGASIVDHFIGSSYS